MKPERTDISAGNTGGIRTEKGEVFCIAAYLLLFFFLAAFMALNMPFANSELHATSPDEPERYLICQYICRHGRLPNGFDPEIRIEGYGISYGFYTMLPYIVQGFVMRFVNLFTDSELMLLYTARFVNVLIGTAMAAVVYGIGRHAFSDRRFRWLFCFLVMYLPQNLFIHTYVNTDSMAVFSASLIVYALLRAYQEDFTPRLCILLAFGIICCALSYYNAYGFILSSIFLFLFFYLRRENGKWRYDARMMWKRGLLTGGIVLLGTGWYFIRNAMLYDGDFLGLESLRLCGSLYGDPSAQPYLYSYAARGLSVSDMLREHSFFKGVYFSFIGCYGTMYLWGNIWMYWFYTAVFAVGIASFLVLRTQGGCTGMTAGRRRFFHANMLLCILIPLGLCLYYAYSMDFQYQGRYVMSAVVPWMYFVTGGLKKLASLEWLPERFGKLRKGMEKLADLCIYVVMGAVLLMIFHMVFGIALPVYRASGPVLN